jgi:hypothetical protein
MGTTTRTPKVRPATPPTHAALHDHHADERSDRKESNLHEANPRAGTPSRTLPGAFEASCACSDRTPNQSTRARIRKQGARLYPVLISQFASVRRTVRLVWMQCVADGIGSPLLRIRQRLPRIRSAQMERPISHSYGEFGKSSSQTPRVAVPRIRSGRVRARQSQAIPDIYCRCGPSWCGVSRWISR